MTRDRSTVLATVHVAGLVVLGLCIVLQAQDATAACPSFSSPSNYNAGGRSLVIADFNKDGHPDIAIASGGAATVFLGRGDGTFGTPHNYPGAFSTWIVAGDVNNDGILDLAGDGSVLLGNGDGTFGPAKNYPAGVSAWGVALGDFNRDGKLDLAAASFPSSNIVIALGNGDGTFRTPTAYTAGSGVVSFAVGDFNHDGMLDLAVGNQFSNDVSVLIGKGDGTFSLAKNYVVGTSGNDHRAVVTADVNRDGNLDLIATNEYSNTVSVLLGNGDGTFAAPVSYAAGTGPAHVVVGDFNADGMLDLAVADYLSGQISILLGDGNGAFTLNQSYIVAGNPYSVAVGDFDSDGRPDLAMSSASGVSSVLLNDSSCNISFTANPASIIVGQTSTLSWTVTNATTVTIDHAIGAQPLSGSVLVSPSTTTTYTLTAVGSSGTFSSRTTVTVTLPPLPTITFTATPTYITAGQASTLSWAVTSADTVTIDHGVGAQPLSGSVLISPSVTTTYTLTATGAGGTSTKQASITVVPPPPAPVISFAANPTSIKPHGTATLSWTVSNTSRVSIDHGIGIQPISGSSVVSPSVTTTYTLTATGVGGTTTAQATVSVVPSRRRAAPH